MPLDEQKREVEMLRQKLEEREQAFQEMEARYHSLFDGSFEGIVIHENGIILDVNPAMQRIMGYTAEDLMGSSVLRLTAPESIDAVEAAMKNQQEEPYEIVGLRKDGTRVDLEILGKYHVYQGRRVRVAAVRDITARKESDATKQHQQTLHEALRDSVAMLNSTLDPDTLMNRILDYVGRVVPHDAANIMLIRGIRARAHYWRGYSEEHAAFLQHYEFNLDDFPTLQYMMQTQSPLAVPDTRARSDWLKGAETVTVRSYAGAPIRLDGEIIGFINLDSETPNALTHTHAEHLQTFADQAAVAIKNARMYDHIRRQAEALQIEILERHQAELTLARRNLLLETLNEISRAAFTRLEVGHIMDTVARLSAQVIDATSAYVCDWNEASGTCTVLADYLSPNANAQERISDKGVTYHIHDDFDDDGAWIRIPEGYTIISLADQGITSKQRQHLIDYGGYTSLYVPLWVENNPIGFIELWDSRPGRTFGKDEIDIVMTIARQVSQTIDKARLHAALKESEARNTAIINALPDYMFRLDKDGFYRDAKLPPSSNTPAGFIIGKQLADTMPPEVAKAALRRIRDVLQTETMDVYEYQLPEADGFRDYEARLVVCGEDEVLAIVRDITERKRYEQELAQARDEALEASRVKSQFLANMSHELRTPLNSIINYTQLMIDGIYGELSRTQADRLEKVIRNGRNLLALINDVLDLSKIEAGHMELNRKRVNTRDLLTMVVEIFKPMAEQKGLTLIYGGGSVADIDADEIRARQVLTNLIGNAIKFTHTGGITVSTTLKDNLLSIVVADTGIGIPEHALNTIFNEFHQVDSSFTRQYEGTGLGLTISKKIVELHGGTIDVTSIVGQGSAFTVRFPIAAEGEPV